MPRAETTIVKKHGPCFHGKLHSTGRGTLNQIIMYINIKLQLERATLERSGRLPSEVMTAEPEGSAGRGRGRSVWREHRM